MACVYSHIRLDKNEVFYIGVGNKLDRPYSKRRRNAHWKSIITKTDYKVEILFDNITYEEALKKENELILLYGRKDLGTGTLVNKTDGGRGSVGTKRHDLIIYNKTRVNPFKGIKRPPEFGKNLSKLKKGVKRPDVSLRLKGKKIGSCPHISESNSRRKGKPLKTRTCPYCKFVGGGGRMTSHHFENCKFKSQQIIDF